MHDFYILSGHQVSYDKCEIFCCTVSHEEQASLAGLLGMKLGKLPIRYLGVPLVSGKLKESDCKALINKITEMVKSWTSKFLSFVGRLQLIDSVINHMINYWFSVFLLPKKVIKAVERICLSFLWNGLPDVSHGAKVKWTQFVFLRLRGDVTPQAR